MTRPPQGEDRTRLVEELLRAAADWQPEAGEPADLETRALQEMDRRGKPIAFICHAGWIPASAGILAGRRATSWPTIADDLINAGAVWEDAEVVVDGNLVSSRKPDDLPAFMRALIGVAAGPATRLEPTAAAESLTIA